MAESVAQRRPVEIQNLSRECHEALILALLFSGPLHGYQLALELEERSGSSFRLSHGTLYPILHRLEQEGLIGGEWLKEDTKRRRKAYALTPTGRRRLVDQIEAWGRFVTRLFSILEVES